MKAKWLLPLMVIVLMSSMLIADPPDWQVITGTQYNMIVMATITLNGNPFEGVDDNMAGAFGPDHSPTNNDCRSVAMWQPDPLNIWYFTIVGNEEPGQIDISFKIYDTPTDEVYDCNETVPFENNITIGSPTDPFLLTAPVAANPGWIAGNVTLVGGTGNVEEVLVSADGYTTNPDANGDYTIEIPAGTYDVTAELEGYATQTVPGVVVEEGVTTSGIDFVLNEYMGPPNWVQIPGTEFNMIVMATINFNGEEFLPEGDNMVGAFGPGGEEDCRAVAVWQIPDFEGFWYMTVVSNDNSGTEMIGFKIYDTGTDAIYDCVETVAFINNYVYGNPGEPYPLTVGEVPHPPTWIPITGTQYNMVVMATFEFNGEEFTGEDLNMTGAFGPGGEEDCRAVGDWQELDLEGFWFFTVVGNEEPGQIDISFKIYDTGTDSVYDCAQTVPFENNTTQGTPDDPILIYAGIAPPPIWTPIVGAQYNMIMMTEVFILPEMTEFDSTAGNLLGAFGYDANGELNEDDCRGLGFWENDDFWYMTILSMDGVAEPIGFKIYDSATGSIYPCNEYVIFEPNAVIGTPDEPFILTTTTEPGDHEFIQLVVPWNWVSFNVMPTNTSIESVFGIDGNIYQVKTRDASSTWYNGAWYGNLHNIEAGVGYMVKVASATLLHIDGTKVDYTTPIPLDMNWNWIGYLPQVPTPLEIAIASVNNNAMQVKGQAQSATQWPVGSGNWYGNLVWMEPADGYKIEMAAEDELIYALGKSANVDEPIATNWEVISGTQYNMVVMANIDIDPTAVVGVFDNEDNCHAVGKWEAYGKDGFWYFTVVGNENGEKLYFKVISDGMNYVGNETITLTDDETIGNPEEPFTVTLSSTGQTAPKAYRISQNYPNPFNPCTTVSFDLPHDATVKLTIYNIKGQEVMSIEKDMTAGYGKTINIDMNKCASGIYFYRISTKDYTDTKKMILMK